MIDEVCSVRGVSDDLSHFYLDSLEDLVFDFFFFKHVFVCLLILSWGLVPQTSIPAFFFF